MNARALAFLALALLPSTALAQPALGPLFRDVTGTVKVPGTGPPVIRTAQGDYTISAEPWRSFLERRDGLAVEARLRVAVPGPSSGPAAVQALYRTIVATVQLPMGGAPMLAENRSNVFQVEGEPWRAFLLSNLDRKVEARIEITEPGIFGGKATIQRLWREVTGKVIVAMDGGPVTLSEDRSNGFRIDGADWKGWLMGRADQQVTVRLEVTQPGPFGGRATIEHASLGTVEGWAQAPGSISVNRSLTLQVKNAPFRAIVAAADGRRVRAQVRLVKPGMFGGEAVVDAIQARNPGATLSVLARPGVTMAVIARITTGRTVRILGKSGSSYLVEVRAGVVGYVHASALEVGTPAPAPTTGIVAAVPGQ